MAVLSTNFSITRASTPPMASLTNDSPSPLPSSSSPPSKKPAKLSKVSKQMGNQNQQLRKQRRGNKPSIAQIERAFGAGSYRDSEG